ncbi:uncharacterized protein BP5553_02946 [Venustampulla echinocandica]|uniref:Uncharacterized protein n=1 Tax=Venustampulla echinocandica TaxID=2656787 RepID=A0A370TSU6_9HELO|nr:uncharacterized protein BP5553_02946 [Venustampulla echinocandica]RDL38606.1 hypothetical protein BP5553_02946 [Venustampulla echinocandica]
MLSSNASSPSSEPGPLSVIPIATECIRIVLECIRIIGKVPASPYEINAHKDLLQMVSTRFDDVNSIRASIYGSSAKFDVIDSQLQSIKSSLENAKQAMSSAAHNRTGKERVGIADSLEWQISYSHIAEANRASLLTCLWSLGEIMTELEYEQNMRLQRRETIYFKSIQEQLWVALSRRAERHSILYSGRGEQLSKCLTVSSYALLQFVYSQANIAPE